jgi:hypothetical protein
MKTIKFTDAVWAERGNIERVPDELAYQMFTATPRQAVYVTKSEWKKDGRYSLGNPHEETDAYIKWKERQIV